MLVELENLVTQYDRGGLTRRQLLQGLLALSVGAEMRFTRSVPDAAPVFKTRTINHVTLYSAEVARSKAFYQSLTGAPVRDEGKDFCELRLERSFLGLYAAESGRKPGFDHFCFGVDDYEPNRAFSALKAVVPDAQPVLESGDQVYVHDPDGVLVQFADLNYKR
ncbi:MAG TPA: VOC family protein [Gemmatimonadaceae bacterium]|nr:VOC family protein [Gemmatimonadaceae bacterium]